MRSRFENTIYKNHINHIFKKSWFIISSLLHLVGLRPRVYYTLTNFFFGGRGASPPWPPQYDNYKESVKTISLCPIYDRQHSHIYFANIAQFMCNSVKLRTKMLGL